MCKYTVGRLALKPPVMRSITMPTGILCILIVLADNGILWMPGGLRASRPTF